MSNVGLMGSCGELHYQVIPSGCINCNAAVVWHETSRDAFVIDPTDSASDVIDFVKSSRLKVQQILLTHAHFDHAADAERAMTEFACPTGLHADDLPLYLDIPYHAPKFGLSVPPRTLALSQVRDNQLLDLIPGYTVEVLHVPGHSPGSVAYHIAETAWAFVGDTLFHGSVGRTDLPGGNSKKLFASIQQRLYQLPDHTIAICGHGATTTIGREKQFNPHVRNAKVEPTP